jgi:putative transposase
MISINTDGRPRVFVMREVVNAVLYLDRSGCQRDMLPHDLPAKGTVYDHFARWRDDGTWRRFQEALRRKVREAAPRVGCIDGQTVKGTEVGGSRGYDCGKKLRGRKHHISTGTRTPTEARHGQRSNRGGPSSANSPRLVK